MFYIILPLLILACAVTYALLKFKFFKDNERFAQITQRVLKICVVVYACMMIIGLLLPDAFALSQSSEYLGGGIHQGHAVIRLLSGTTFVLLPISIFFKNRNIRNITIYFTIIISCLQIAFYGEYITWFTSEAGRGLASLPISEGFKNFLLNRTFRGIYFGIELFFQITLPLILAMNEKHVFNVKDRGEWGRFFLYIPLLIITCTPIYAPQYLFGYSNILFKPYGYLHFLWIIVVIGLCFGLYFAFRKRSQEDKFVLLFVLSLSLIMQYNQMFSAISLNVKRLPLQLCNIGAFFVLLSLITKNRVIFNFTAIINVVGVLFALSMPDVDGKGLFYLYNIHFIFEHTNVLVIPLLALAFGLFPRLDKKALKDCILLFSIYFITVLCLGTMFNAISLATGKGIYEANWMFMFSQAVASSKLPSVGKLFDINFKIGYATFYPVIQLLVYVVFLAVVILIYFLIRLIYLCKDKISSPQKSKGGL